MLEKFVLITITFQGAALAISFVGLIAVHELKRYLDSPSWNRKQWAWVAFISCQALALGDRIHSPRGTLVSVTYCAILFLSTCGFCDSYRLLLKSPAASPSPTSTPTESPTSTPTPTPTPTPLPSPTQTPIPTPTPTPTPKPSPTVSPSPSPCRKFNPQGKCIKK